MATRSQIIQELGDVFGRTASSVAALDRELAGAGLRAPSARGRAAQPMSKDDYANVTIGLMGNWSLRQAPIMVERLGMLQLQNGSFEEYKYNQEGEMIDFKMGDTLTAVDILKPFTSDAYPRHRLPMAPTLTGAFASILEHLPTLDELTSCKVTLHPEKPGAELQFRLGNRKYIIEFGDGNQLPQNEIYRTTSVLLTEGVKRISTIFHRQ